MRHIHLGKHSDVPEQVVMGQALCNAGYGSRTEHEQQVTAIFDDVTCRNCIRIVRASNRRDDEAEGPEPDELRKIARILLRWVKKHPELKEGEDVTLQRAADILRSLAYFDDPRC